MNGDDFVLAADGWSQITPCGEFPHAGAGVVQVIDRAACDVMAAEFNARKADANFPGVLVDFDHFSLDTGQSSEAAGWITELESRDTGRWARVRQAQESYGGAGERRKGLRRRGRPYCGNRPERRKGSSTFNPRL